MGKPKTDAIESVFKDFLHAEPWSKIEVDEARSQLAALLAALHTAEILHEDADKEVKRLGMDNYTLGKMLDETTERIVELERDGCMRRDAIAAAEERGFNLASHKIHRDEPARDMYDRTYAEAKATEAKEQGK